MQPIAIYHHPDRIWYPDFATILDDFTDGDETNTDNSLWAYIGHIVLYNVRYRDILRAEGIDGILKTLFAEAPAFRYQTNAIQYLCSSVDRHGRLADYDIQCLSIGDAFQVHGREFNGLDEVKGKVDWYLRDGGEPRAARPQGFRFNPLHILCNYEPYPIFDSSDWGDDRTYCNYFFLNRQFQPSDFKEITGIKPDGNSCKAHERLPHTGECPLLYYPGDGKTMLLVTPK